MKFIDKLTRDYNNGLFENGLVRKARFSPAGVNWWYETITDDGKGRYYTSHIQGTNAYKIMNNFIKEHNITTINR